MLDISLIYKYNPNIVVVYEYECGIYFVCTWPRFEALLIYVDPLRLQLSQLASNGIKFADSKDPFP